MSDKCMPDIVVEEMERRLKEVTDYGQSVCDQFTCDYCPLYSAYCNLIIHIEEKVQLVNEGKEEDV